MRPKVVGYMLFALSFKIYLNTCNSHVCCHQYQQGQLVRCGVVTCHYCNITLNLIQVPYFILRGLLLHTINVMFLAFTFLSILIIKIQDIGVHHANIIVGLGLGQRNWYIITMSFVIMVLQKFLSLVQKGGERTNCVWV